MPRGQTSHVGSTMVNKNGYHHTKTEDGWRLTHHILAEERLKRKLKPSEGVRFRDGDRTNLDPDNLEVVRKGQGSIKAQIAKLNERIRELTAQKTELEKRLDVREELGAE